MINEKKVTAIILIAGNSTRYGQGRNKNFELIDGKTVVSYSLHAFEQNDYVDDIILTIKAEDEPKVNEILQQEKLKKKVQVVLGGNTRSESVYQGLKNTKSDIVIIHDGARPAIKQSYIKQEIESMEEFQGVTVGVKSKDTIKITDDNNIVTSTTKRSNTWLIQTPQCFVRKTLQKSHEKHKHEEVTDDCMLLEKEGYPIKILEGDYTNIKITTYEDLAIMQKMMGDNLAIYL